MGAKYKLSLSMVIVCNETGEERDAEAELCMSSFPEKMQRRVDELLADGEPLEDIGFFLNEPSFNELIFHAIAQGYYLVSSSVDDEEDPLGKGCSVGGCSIASIKELN